MTHVILPIMFDLAEQGTKIVPGPGTIYTLEEAATLANRRAAASKVLFTACEAIKPQWRQVNMGRLCETWFKRRWPHLDTAYEQAKTFNTIGEIEALDRYLKKHEDIQSASIVVKSWHAPRVRLFVQRLQEVGCLPIQVAVIPHRYPWRLDIWYLDWRLREYVAYGYWYTRYRPP